MALAAVGAAPAANATQSQSLTGPLVSTTGSWLGAADENELVPVLAVDPAVEWTIPQLGETGEVRAGALCLTIYRDAFSSYTDFRLLECMGAHEQDFVVVPGSAPGTIQLHSMSSLRVPMDGDELATLPLSADASSSRTITLGEATDFELSALSGTPASVDSDWWWWELGM